MYNTYRVNFRDPSKLILNNYLFKLINKNNQIVNTELSKYYRKVAFICKQIPVFSKSSF